MLKAKKVMSANEKKSLKNVLHSEYSYSGGELDRLTRNLQHPECQSDIDSRQSVQAEDGGKH